jgi:hypothetical protein
MNAHDTASFNRTEHLRNVLPRALRHRDPRIWRTATIPRHTDRLATASVVRTTHTKHDLPRKRASMNKACVSHTRPRIVIYKFEKSKCSGYCSHRNRQLGEYPTTHRFIMTPSVCDPSTWYFVRQGAQRSTACQVFCLLLGSS